MAAKNSVLTQVEYLRRVNLAIDYVFMHLNESLRLRRVRRAKQSRTLCPNAPHGHRPIPDPA